MGIRHLNNYLRNNCQESIKCISLSELSNKKIVIDTSIYMYRYTSENTLIESFYLMMGLFHRHNITPVFVFDGKPPAEKKELLAYRKQLRLENEEEYNKLELDIQTTSDQFEKKQKMEKLIILKKKYPHITKKQINCVKQLIMAFGYSYYMSPGEADVVCASLTINNKVWACMSEDMDMFVYGCPRIVRYFSIINQSMVIYNVQSILNNLSLSQSHFRQICVLSGTDYNSISYNNTNNLYNIIKLFYQYKKTEYCDSFYKWMEENNYITDYNKIIKIDEMFKNASDLIVDIQILNGPVNKNVIQDILIDDGFIFP